MNTPRVSILIPNYNNGIQSSSDQKTNLILDLLTSLSTTLADETTPFEIIACDDGSTDDSLQTLQDYTTETFPVGSINAGKPILSKLITQPHSGILSVAANKLVEASSGDILVRLDGDIIIHTLNWASILTAIFDNAPNTLGAVGPLQLTPQGHVHAFGDMLLHPKGYHHIGAGYPPSAFTRPLEVDHVMGCFYCTKRTIHDELDGYDENILRGQTVDFGLRVRQAGYSCIAVPTISFTHNHSLREQRSTEADELSGIHKTLDIFREKWGFDRIAPDLDAIYHRYKGTPLLWNHRVFGNPSDWPPFSSASDSNNTTVQQSTGELAFEDADWGKYGKDDELTKQINTRVSFVISALKQLPKMDRPRLTIIGHGASVMSHIFATQSLPYAGVDDDIARINLSKRCINNQSYPEGTPKPTYHHMPIRTQPPTDLVSGESDIVAIFNQLEHHPNPVSLLNFAHELLGEGDHKYLILVTRAAPPRGESMTDPLNLFTSQQLLSLLVHSKPWHPMSNPAQSDDPDNLVLLAQRKTETPAFPAEDLSSTTTLATN